MRITASLMMALLAGCSDTSHQPVPDRSEPPPNHWAVVPSGPSTIDGITYQTAWRLDTQTGELSFCYYDNGPETPVVARNGKVLSRGPNVSCVASDPPR